MSETALRLLLFGAGRMGAAVAAAARSEGCAEIVAVVAPRRPDWLGSARYCGALDQAATVPADLLIDFTLPDGTALAAAFCQATGLPMLSGVTGLHAAATEALSAAARRVPVLWAPNLSQGVNLLARLCEVAAAALPATTPVRIRDVHHRDKRDAPSGTALMLADAVRRARGADAPAVRFESIREGAEIGRHTVSFLLPGEELELGHAAGDRAIFARGTLAAARWLLQQAPGRYSASDWIGAAAHR